MSLSRRIRKIWAALRQPGALRVLYQGVTLAPRLIIHLASVAVLAGVFYYSFDLSERRFSPEEGRARGGGVGASFYNRPEVVHPRSKIEKSESP